MKQHSLTITPRAIPCNSGINLDHLPCLPEQPSYMDFFYKQLFDDVENARLKQIEDRLLELGYRFGSEFILKEFLTENATIVTHIDKPDYREMYLFAGTKDQATVGSWWETYEFVPNYEGPQNGYKVTVIAGKEPIH